jgi:hypothetical protein
MDANEHEQKDAPMQMYPLVAAIRQEFEKRYQHTD